MIKGKTGLDAWLKWMPLLSLSHWLYTVGVELPAETRVVLLLSVLYQHMRCVAVICIVSAHGLCCCYLYCISTRVVLLSVLYQHTGCVVISIVSAHGLCCFQCCISTRVVLLSVLYQHTGCIIISIVSAHELCCYKYCISTRVVLSVLYHIFDTWIRSWCRLYW